MRNIVKKCIISAISVAVLSIGIYGATVLASHRTDADDDPLAPYQAVLDQFNADHGTSYSFLSDAQLEQMGQTREEYLKKMEQEYAKMTPEEFREHLETVYSGEQVEIASSGEAEEGVVYIDVEN